MSTYFNPGGEDMDVINEFNKQMMREDELLKQALRMMDKKDVYGQLYLPTRDHVRVLVQEIARLKDQLNLKEVYEEKDHQDSTTRHP